MPSSIPVAYPRLTSLNCFLFCFRNSMIDNMREIEKCKAHVQDVEVPLEVFEWVHCCWFPCKLIITTGHYNRDQAIIKSQVCHEHHTIFIPSITKECIETFSLRFEVAKCNITVKKIVLNRISWSKCPGASQNFGLKEGCLLEGGRLFKGALVKNSPFNEMKLYFGLKKLQTLSTQMWSQYGRVQIELSFITELSIRPQHY